MSSAASAFDNVRVEKKSPVAYVTVQREKVLNTLNVTTLQEIRQSLTALQGDEQIRVIILTGAGEKAFVAGADISELAKLDSVSGKAYAQLGQAIFELLENLGKPVIACVNGYALGGGCELAMACTLRLASENARLGLPEAKLGLIPGYGGTQRLARLIGKGRALQLILSGEPITAQEAYRIGLVNEVLPLAELIPRAESIAQTIANNGPLAVRYGLEAVNRGMEMSKEQGILLEASLFGILCGTSDKDEGSRAFLEKRPPKFKGK